MTTINFSQTAGFIWAVADLLRGDFKQSQYGRIILPFTLLRRLECVLAPTKAEVLVALQESAGLNEKIVERNLRKAAAHNFYNTSKMDMSTLGVADIKDNLNHYILSFSKDAREIFEYFRFGEFLELLNEANLLYKVVNKFANYDLSPQSISNHDMGLVFEELIRRFAESSNETAGEHFTPRDIVELTTELAFMTDEELLSREAVVRTIYDPTAGTGGFLSSGMEYVHKLNPQAIIKGFGQELNPESYAICKGDMLIKAQSVDQIKLGNTLSDDQLAEFKFDYMLSNPPFGVDWKKIEDSVISEHHRGEQGRFAPGLPRVSDGSLLFLLHLIDKMRSVEDGGSRIGIILNGSPLFTGSAGSGESEIRRFVLESDLLEAIVALPTDMFYNTGIATYIWVLSNKKQAARKGQVQLINGVNLHGKMRKSLGSKRNLMSEVDIATITRTFGAFAAVEACEVDKPAATKSSRGRQAANSGKVEAPKTFASKIFKNHQFGYRRITIERPLRESFQFSDERIASLRFAAKPLNAPMQWLYDTYSRANLQAQWTDDPDCPHYGQLKAHEKDIRAHFKKHFELKEKQIKTLLDDKTWTNHKHTLLLARQLQNHIGSDQYDDMNRFEALIKAACKAQNIKLEPKDKKPITSAVSWINPDAEKVIKKIHPVGTKANPLYGLFPLAAGVIGEVKGEAGRVVEYKADGGLRDNENVPLDPDKAVNDLNEAYFKREVQPHVPDAWIDGSKKDKLDGQIGIVGYEIPFNRHFYQYQPPRDLAEIDADLDAVSAEIMQLLQEVHS